MASVDVALADEADLPGRLSKAPRPAVKLRDIVKKQRQDMEENESPDLNFVYADADIPSAEIAELYSYTEEPEFVQIRAAAEEQFEAILHKPWRASSPREQQECILILLDKLDFWRESERIQAVRTLLYIVQGVCGECENAEQQEELAWQGSLLIVRNNGYPVLVQLLVMELGLAQQQDSTTPKKPTVTVADNVNTRLCCSLLCTIVEYMRLPGRNESAEEKALRQQFALEIGQPVGDNPCLAVILFDALVQFCSTSMPPFPIRKLVILLWKTVLVSLGSIQDQVYRKMAARKAAGLPPPPPTDFTPATPEYDVPSSQAWPAKHPVGLKARQKDVDSFVEFSRGKFVGYTVAGDTDTLAGIPQPLHEGVFVMKQHVYRSLGDVQVEHEELLGETKISRPVTETRKCVHQPTEDLYVAMYSHIPQYMIALLKILLAAATSVKAKSDSINILVDVLPEEMPTTVVQSMKLGVDVNRHKEIIIKACSALLLLLLKHFKVNHVYQFEYVSQHLVFANCIPLILKFFNQNISAFITSKNSIPMLDFPAFAFSESAEITAESLEAGNDKPFCWRNLFSCINLLRILQKLIKWKHSRTMMLVVFKSAPILKRAMKVKHPLLQLYILKLLKVQTRYLGRNWRKSNMKTMSAIYHRVRHRLNDDWAFGNDQDARPWDLQVEECSLRSRVEQFNARHYGAVEEEEPSGDPLIEATRPVDNNPLNVLATAPPLSQHFMENYEAWLEAEVFSRQDEPSRDFVL